MAEICYDKDDNIHPAYRVHYTDTQRTALETERQELAALGRVQSALERAEHEYPILAAPDGTVSVDIDDLKHVLTRLAGLTDFWRSKR